ncbi:hypothetical protein COL68_14010 [Bacillus wiedmannii]|nr:hypothetical protein CN672_07405 [Bacillus wiedmannii]PEM99456.1 hypothetical protein CN621_20470 [Bacillus wiedmannii]PEO14628.1 hypothetical protein CN562_08420 [Bacillus wiedmannii]PEP51546.1 hypothetical protein CN557_17575 [Bacillus wiedmannii]PEQ07183.1 hypothetical protein CN587_02850 [Bacillus wiedmannii]
MVDINSHLAKTRNSITSGIKNVIASFYAYKKRPFCGLFYVYPALMGSKIPTSKFSESKDVRWGTNCP